METDGMLMTATEAAELFGKVDNLSSEEVRSLARRIRHFDAGKLIEAAPEKRDRRGTSQFPFAEICKARLLSTLADYGFAGAHLEAASDAMSPRATGVLISGGVITPHWGEATTENPIPPLQHHLHLPNRVRAGEEVALRLLLTEQAGKRMLSGYLAAENEGPDQDEQQAWDQLRQLQEIRVIGSVTLSASDLIRPLLDLIPEED